jgi:hypothetical protein
MAIALAVHVQPSLVPSATLFGWLSAQYISAPITEKWNRVLKVFGSLASAGASITTTITSAESSLAMAVIFLLRSACRQCQPVKTRAANFDVNAQAAGGEVVT